MQRGVGGQGRRSGTLRGAFDISDDDDVLGKVYDHRVAVRLAGYLRPYKFRAILALLSMVVYSLTSLATPWLVGRAIDGFIATGDLRGLGFLTLAFMGNGLVSWLAYYGEFMFSARIGYGVLFTMRRQLFDHLQRLPIYFFDQNEAGRIMSRVQNDVEQLEDILATGFLAIVGDLLILGGIIVMLFSMNPRLALLTLAVVPVLVVALAVWQRYARSAFVRTRQAIALVNAGLHENISGVRVIQSLNREKLNLQRFGSVNEGHLNANLRAGRLTAALMPAVEILVALSTAIVLIFGGAQVLAGQFHIGALVAFTLYIQRFFDPIRGLTMQYTELQRSMASGSRIFELLDYEPEPEDLPDALDPPSLKGEIRFDQVSFSYIEGIEVLHDFTLHIHPGETVALVGPTGAGKTTVANLLLRFYEAGSGTISIDGRDIHRFARQALSRHLSIVPQDPFLFSGSVRDNIRYGRLSASDEEVVAAAQTVGADQFIQRLERGYDTLLQERGGNLSMGQRQLISFARAVLANPAILILDEATANVDTQTESLIQRALTRLLHKRTSLVIAHRLSTIKDADRIVVLDRGTLVEMGSHQELLDKGGLYAQLYAMNYAVTSVEK